MSAAPVLWDDRLPGLLGELLDDQADLSAVDVFARRHDEGALPASARFYEERIPVGDPGPGERLAFRVDLDACTGCKACVTACHNLNGLAPDEAWRDVGLLLGVAEDAGVQQTVTTACHHCEDPACLAGCPVKAYEQDPATGIVRHLDDQCIGCQYCVLKCPYDVPKFSETLGIVRKCDMCTGRLAEGEAPACVQGCPNGAISIEIVKRDASGTVRELLGAAAVALPDSSYTRPTTRYVSQRPLAGLRAADRHRLAPSQAHDPLAVMLVAMQLSVGALAAAVVAAGLGVLSPLARTAVLALAALSAMSGLGAATLHLGRPRYAFRAFLGWRTSWMSREILVFGAYVPALALAALASGLDAFGGSIPQLPAALPGLAASALPALAAVALCAGVLGSVCSVMIYVDTHRPAWALARTAPTFVGTLLGVGAFAAATAWALASWWEGQAAPVGATLLLLLGAGVLCAKVAAERRLCARRDVPEEPLARTARLLRGPLRARMQVRFALFAAGLVACLAAVGLGVTGSASGLAVGAALALALSALGETVERQLYFTSEAAPAMPGH